MKLKFVWAKVSATLSSHTLERSSRPIFVPFQRSSMSLEAFHNVAAVILYLQTEQGSSGPFSYYQSLSSNLNHHPRETQALNPNRSPSRPPIRVSLPPNLHHDRIVANADEEARHFMCSPEALCHSCTFQCRITTIKSCRDLIRYGRLQFVGVQILSGLAGCDHDLYIR
jgi:hypothetical protein